MSIVTLLSFEPSPDKKDVLKGFYYNHFEITGDPCYMIGSQSVVRFIHESFLFFFFFWPIKMKMK